MGARFGRTLWPHYVAARFGRTLAAFTARLRNLGAAVLAGQLFTHMHACQMGKSKEDGLRPVMSDEQMIKTLLLILHLDPS